MSTKRQHPVENDEATSSKSQKLENVYSMGFFDHLCEEMKEMIFDSLSGKDLINLASCNKALNEYIGNKSRYMKKIFLAINKVNKDCITLRKYENLIFKEKMLECELRDISFFDDDASKIIKSIAFNRVLTTELFNKLILFTNLEGLKIENFSNFKIGSATVIMPSLKSLVITSANINMKVFANCKLKNLEITRFSNNAIDSFKMLIKNQTELKRLHLGACRVFFMNNLFEEAPFKLTELSLAHHRLTNARLTSNFLSFINKHRETLQTISCKSTEMLRFFSNFENLRNVELLKYYEQFAYDMSFTSRFDQVQKLELKCERSWRRATCFKNLDGIEKNFPNLQELSIQYGKMDKAKFFSTLTNLKKLTFIDTVMVSELIIPAVEDLSFIDCTFLLAKMPFDFSASSIRNLKIHQCVEIQWVHAFLKHPGTNLAIFDASPSGEFEEYANADKFKTFIRN